MHLLQVVCFASPAPSANGSVNSWLCQQTSAAQTEQAPGCATTPLGALDMLQRTHTAPWAGGAPGTSMTRISRLPRCQLSPSARATSIAGMRARSAAGPTTVAPYRRFSSSLPPTWSLPQFVFDFTQWALGRAYIARGAARRHALQRSNRRNAGANVPRRSARTRARLLHTGASVPGRACCCRQDTKGPWRAGQAKRASGGAC
jgi:hypothetical protein